MTKQELNKCFGGHGLEQNTIGFIKDLLQREIESEIIQDNMNPAEVEYVNELAEASNDFIANYGEWFETIYIEEKIKEMLKED